MALTDENGVSTTMLVSPTGGAYPMQNGGFGNGFGGDGWWIVLLIILLAAGNGFGGYGGGYNGQPVIVNDGGGSVQRGFDQAAVIGAIGNVQNGIYDVSTQLCNGFAGVNATVNNGFAQAEIANNSRQIANMQQSFANQMATTQGFNQLGTQFADCLKKTIKKAKDSLVFTKYTVGSCAA